MKIAFYPDLQLKANSYISSIIQAIKTSSPNVKIEKFPRSKEILKGNFDFDVAWLNWYENLPSKKFYFFKSLITQFLVLKKLKKSGIKIYTVFHNKQPHQSLFPTLNLKFYKSLLRNSDKIIILSDRSREYIKNLIGESQLEKIVKISHPSYKINYNNHKISLDKKFTALFFGQLKPYKNIELIIQLAKNHPNINFIIAGKPYTELYSKELINACEPLSNLKLILQYLKDEDIEKLSANSNIILLPYNIKSSLNSGSLFHSLSMGNNVIIPKIASVEEFSNMNLIYHYSYENEENHYQMLEQKLIEAYNDFTEHPDLYLKKSNILQEEVNTFNQEYIANQIKNANLF